MWELVAIVEDLAARVEAGHKPDCKGSPVTYATHPPQYGYIGCTCHKDVE